MSIEVTATDAHLSLRYQQQASVPLVPTSATTFAVAGTNTSVEFERKDRRRVVALTLMQEGTMISARKATKPEEKFYAEAN